MKVAFDTLFLADRYRHTGTGVYLGHLLHACLKLSESDSKDVEFHGFVGPGETWHRNGLSSAPLHVHQSRLLGVRRLWLFGGMAAHTTALRPDLVFLPTAHQSIPGPFAPVVTTVLDAIPRRLPSLVGRTQLRLNLMTWLSGKLSARIITISEWSKRDLVELYDMDPSRIEVTYLGYDRDQFNETSVDPDLSSLLLRHLGIRSPFILHHGLVQKRKNVHRLVQAWDLVCERCKSADLQLVLAGPMGFGSEEVCRLREASPNRARIILTGPLSDADLATLVKSAFLCVIPSLYEGFCLPMVEAMACGVPTIASSSSCMPEISGGVLDYFDPLAVEDIADKILRALGDSDLRNSLRLKGLLRASDFSWERCGRETLSIFRKAITENRKTLSVARS
jgi:glycosyltransferase involved in cell wall biosynthesis